MSPGGEFSGRSTVDDAPLLASDDLSKHGLNAGHPAWHDIAGIQCAAHHRLTIFPAPVELRVAPRPAAALSQV